jgi:hypothetical protein
MLSPVTILGEQEQLARINQPKCVEIEGVVVGQSPTTSNYCFLGFLNNNQYPCMHAQKKPEATRTGEYANQKHGLG